MDFATAVKWYFDTAWAFLTSFNIPGTNFTPFAALFFGAFFVLIVGFIRSVVARASGSGSGGRRASSPPKSGKNEV